MNRKHNVDVRERERDYTTDYWEELIISMYLGA